jgi:hypothetical protein
MPNKRGRAFVPLRLGDLFYHERDLADRQARWLLELLAGGLRPVLEIKRLAQP